jgi:hypothetical protein
MRFPLLLAFGCLAFACGGTTNGERAPVGDGPVCRARGDSQIALEAPGLSANHLVSTGKTLYAGGITYPGDAFELWSATPGNDAPKRVPDGKYAKQSMALGPNGSLVYITAEYALVPNAVTFRPNGIMLHDA